jgi:putative glycosyltransferase (TIGR04372 family)
LISLLIKFLNNRKNFNYYFYVTVPYAIGSACEQALILSISNKNKDKKIIILSHKIFEKFLKYRNHISFLSDKILHKNKSINPILKIFINLILSIEFFFCRVFFLYIKKEKTDKSFIVNGWNELFLEDLHKFILKKNDSSIHKFNINKLNFFSIKNNERDRCNEIYKSNKFNPDKKIVCLHVRDSKFHDDKNRRVFRNSNIINYYELINFLKKNDYTIFRMGQEASSKLKIADGKTIIDYPFSDFKSKAMDFFLASKCSFHIAGGGGFTQIPNLFHKPCLWTNVYRVFSELPLNIKSRMIFKKIYWKNNKQRVFFKDYLNMSYYYHHVRYLDDELIFKENTPEELYNSMKNFLLSFEKEKNRLDIYQVKFNNFLYKRLKEMFFEELDNQSCTITTTDKVHMYKQLSLLKIIKGSFDSDFLKEQYYYE